MKILIVGSDGFIGGRLTLLAVQAGHEVRPTTRRTPGILRPLLDLKTADEFAPDGCDVAFLCAGVSNYRDCEGNAEAWRVNVDGNIALGKALMRAGSFVVFLSSVAAEWAGHSAYGRMKIAVELALQCLGDPAIVRTERVTPDRLEAFCAEVLAIGLARRPGIYHL